MLDVKERAVKNKALNQGVRSLVIRSFGEGIWDILIGLKSILLPNYDISTPNVTDKLQQSYL